jgi:Fe-S-cluster-containing dehydrogenase component
MPDPQNGKGGELAMYGIRLFEETCVGCRSCMVACQAVRGLAAGSKPLVIKVAEEESAEGLRLRFSAEACRHCDDAPCAAGCPTEAIMRDNDGRVVLKEEDCINCGSCVEDCPFEAVTIDVERNLAVKCDLCSARTAEGLSPACVAACPGKAIYAGSLDEIDAAIEFRRREMLRVRDEVDARAEEFLAAGDIKLP